MAKEDCHKPQFAHEMHYGSEMHINMNDGKGYSSGPGTHARSHQHTIAKDRLIEHTMRTEMHDIAAPGVDTHMAKGIIGNANHKMNWNFPVGKDPKKVVSRQPIKASPKGTFKGGL